MHVIHLAARARAGRGGAVSRRRRSAAGGHDAALLLRDALLLSLRRGAGPFRSFGQIAVEPRAYQLVPLLMALKLDPVRLLIADDVGVGKTIEARPHRPRAARPRRHRSHSPSCARRTSSTQWATELEERFHILRAAGHREHARRGSSAAFRRRFASSDAIPHHGRQPRLHQERRRRDDSRERLPRLRHRRRGAHLRAAAGGKQPLRALLNLADNPRATSSCSPPRRTAATRAASSSARPARSGLRASWPTSPGRAREACDAPRAPFRPAPPHRHRRVGRERPLPRRRVAES